MIDVRSKYHIALNDIGFVLQGSPENPSYVMNQGALFNNRLAQGDRTYDDFAKWWYLAQTDWFQGFKDDPAWEDDGMFYYSTNVDTWSNQGSVALAKRQDLLSALGADILCGCEGTVNSNSYIFVGTGDDAGSKPIVYAYRSGTWVNIVASQMSTNQNCVSQLSTRLNYLWISTIGNGMTNVVLWWSGTAFKDCGANISSVLTGTWQFGSSRCHVTIGTKIYIAVDNASNNKWAIVSATSANPSANGDWTKVIENTAADGYPISMIEYNGNLYYLVYHSYYLELRMYNIATAVDVSVKNFVGSSASSWGASNYLQVLNGKLIITIPPKEVWTYDGLDFTRIYVRDSNKYSHSDENSTAYLYHGGIVAEDKVWWGNLIYDGEHLYNWIKPVNDDYTYDTWPIFTGLNGTMYLCDTTNINNIYQLGGNYKGTTNKNYIVFNNFDKVSGLDKIAFSVTLIFNKFISGQSIVVEYLTDELDYNSTWSVLGTAGYTLDGSSVTSKVLFFPANTTFKKIWLRVKFNGDGSSTPTMKDLIMAYVPIPFLDKEWTINIDCGDELKLLNGALESRNGRELKGKLEYAWLNRLPVDFQDTDYFSTTLTSSLAAGAVTASVADTSEAPEVGRIKIDDEVIYYSGKTQTSLTNLSRGQKGTKAVLHSNGATVHNGYKVLIQNFRASIPIINQSKRIEYVVGLNLRELI